ncbi:MAG TPA: hypothetical protein VFT66_15725 [Roseiflexaceae bacterium]|nr:hypothetical protein [Roseiflexaceae bacterium]
MGKPEPWVSWALGLMALSMLALLILGLARDDGERIAAAAVGLLFLVVCLAAAVWGTL